MKGRHDLRGAPSAAVGHRGPVSWLVVHLVSVAVLAGVGWVVQAVVYSAFRLVGPGEWAHYHAVHMRAIAWVVGAPWIAQGLSTVVLVLAPPDGNRAAAVVLAVLAVVTVAATVASAVPAHGRLEARRGGADLRTLLRANLVRTLAWTGATVIAVVLVYRETR
jgi:mRNA-degrading endonuclease toxin of MazEF toxin-antitoxin module